MANELVIGADNIITIDKLMVPNSNPPSYIDNATITWQLLDLNNVLISSGSFTYVSGSEGQYTTTIPQAVTTNLTASAQYTFKQSVTATGFTSAFTDTYTAVTPDSSQFTYAVRSDLENIFGALNIQKWADIDNDGVATKIDARINWALELTYNEINSMLDGGIYTMPFQGRFPIIVNIQANLAAALLYESRGLTNTTPEGEPIHQLATHRKVALNKLKQIRGGVLRVHGTKASDINGTIIPLAIRSHRHRHHLSDWFYPFY